MLALEERPGICGTSKESKYSWVKKGGDVIEEKRILSCTGGGLETRILEGGTLRQRWFLFLQSSEEESPELENCSCGGKDCLMKICIVGKERL